MLSSLGVAGVLSVVAVLTASLSVVWQVAATAVLTALSIGFLLQASVQLGKSSLGVKIAQLGAILSYLFMICGTWRIINPEYSWGTAFVCIGCFTVAAIGLSVHSQPNYRYTGIAAVVASSVSGVLWLVGIWFARYDPQIMASGLAISGWGAAAAVCLLGAGTEQVRHWGWIGFAAAAIGWLLSQYAIYQKINVEAVSDYLFVLGSVVVVVIHSVLCYSSRAAPPKLTIRPVAIIFTIITALLCDAIVLLNVKGDQILLRLTIASAILASTSTIITTFIIQKNWRQSLLIPNAVGLSKNQLGQIAEFNALVITCPQCLQPASIAIGNSKCPHCALRFQIEIYPTISTSETPVKWRI